MIAVGNPFGLGGTVTRGIVSAMARDINAGPYVDFIQTDAAINRGNSGGPLLNLEGEVIGVNSAIYSPNGGSVGVGFAIPSNTVKTVVAQLRDGGSVERGWLGVTIQNVTPEIAAAIGLDDPHGALVSDVLPDGPSVGKLKTGDVILSLRRQARRVRAASCRSSSPPPRPTRRSRSRCCARARTRRVDVQARPLRRGARRLRRARRRPTRATASDRLGATLAPITPAAREQLGLDDDVDGVVITSLDGTGLAADAGLEVGDVILQVGDTDVRSPSDVDQALHAAKTDAVLLQIERARREDLRRRPARLTPRPRTRPARPGRPYPGAHSMSRRILVVEDDADTRDYLAKGAARGRLHRRGDAPPAATG